MDENDDVGQRRQAVWKWLESDKPSNTQFDGYWRVLERVSMAIAESSLERGLSMDALQDAVANLKEFLWSFNLAVYPEIGDGDVRLQSYALKGKPLDEINELRARMLWRQPDLDAIMAEGYGHPEYIQVPTERGEELVSGYLRKPQIHNDYLEWMLLGMLVCSETIAFGESIKRGLEALPKDSIGMRPAYYKHAGNLSQLRRVALMVSLIKVGYWLTAFVVVPTLALLVLRSYDQVALAAIGLYCIGAIHLSFRGVKWLLQSLLGRSRGPTLTQEKFNLWQLMRNAAVSLRGDVINPGLSAQLLAKAGDAGAVWSPCVSTLIDRAIDRSRHTWVLSA